MKKLILPFLLSACIVHAQTSINLLDSNYKQFPFEFRFDSTNYGKVKAGYEVLTSFLNYGKYEVAISDIYSLRLKYGQDIIVTIRNDEIQAINLYQKGNLYYAVCYTRLTCKNIRREDVVKKIIEVTLAVNEKFL